MYVGLLFKKKKKIRQPICIEYTINGILLYKKKGK